MVSHAHSLGFKAGWYLNNCMCMEKSMSDEMVGKVMRGSVKALRDAGFDGVKLDSCGQLLNLSWWNTLFNASGPGGVLVDSCHLGLDTPGSSRSLRDSNAPCAGREMPSGCPYNMFTSAQWDIRPVYSGAGYLTILSHLNTTAPYLGDHSLSRPGAWANPDVRPSCPPSAHPTLYIYKTL